MLFSSETNAWVSDEGLLCPAMGCRCSAPATAGCRSAWRIRCESPRRSNGGLCLCPFAARRSCCTTPRGAERRRTTGRKGKELEAGVAATKGGAVRGDGNHSFLTLCANRRCREAVPINSILTSSAAPLSRKARVPQRPCVVRTPPIETGVLSSNRAKSLSGVQNC